MEDLIGHSLGRYHILEQLGAGGMAIVYKAFDTRLETDVAVKVIRMENLTLGTMDRTLKRFEREAKALARLTHPNIVKVTDYGEYEGKPYLVMPYLPGGTLKGHLGKAMPWQDALRILIPIANALEYAHEHDIIHRDIKPSNILITEKGQPMLSDFGVAKLLDAEETVELTGTGVGIGTPEYMAPEQATAKNVDHRADIYSLGIVLYEMVTGRKPFVADTPMAVMIMHSRDPLPRPRNFAPSLPQGVENILLKALAKDPNNRYQNMGEFAKALEGLSNGRKSNHKTVSPKANDMDTRKRLSKDKPSPTPIRLVKTIGFTILGVGLILILYYLLSTLFPQLPTLTIQNYPSPTLSTIPTITQTPINAPPADSLKVGVLAPLSGSVPTFGSAMKNGVELATEEWNAKGGVLGKKIELVVEDSQCEADPAVNAANKVIDQDGVKYIIGELCSKASIPVSEIAEAKGVVQISGGSTNANVTLNVDGSTKAFVFRTCFIDPFQGLVGAKFATENLGAKTAFIMLDQGNEYVRGLAEAFEASFTEMGGTVVGKETYTSTDTDFSAILSKVQEAKPDVIFLPDYYPIVNLVGAQAKQMGITAPMLGGDGWDSPDLSGASAAGGYFVNHYTSDSTAPIVVDFVSKFKAKYGTAPDAIAALTYDAANMLYASIEAVSTTDDTTAVAKAMERLKWEGVTGSITFDQYHNPVKGAVVMKVTKDGVIYEALVSP